MFGTEPTVISAWLPSTVRPSSISTRTPFSDRRTAAARARLTISPPCSAKTCSITSAASESSPGSTRSRLDTSVTRTPISRYALANSAPVTPEPTTTRCSGSSPRSYTCRQVRMRSESGTAPGSTRGVAPVASSTTSASSGSTEDPAGSTTSIRCPRPGCSAANRPRPVTSRTPSPASRLRTSSDCASARSRTRRLTTGASARTWSTSPPSCRTPSAGAARKAVIVSLVAISVLDGTQS